MIDPNKLCLGCMNELEEGNKTCKICGWNSEADENKPHQLKCGTVLQGKYLVGKVLGEGGFGITYLGYNLILQEKVAIKEFYPHGFVGREITYGLTVEAFDGKETFVNKSKDAFIKEAKTMSNLNRVNGIVEMRDVFSENQSVYIVMEYVEGQTLKEYVKENGNKLPMSTVLKLLEPVMDALEQIHAHNLIHRDISPDNIMVGPDGRVTLLDLGAARQISADGSHSLTVNVKHGYAPMEQYQTHGEQGPWTDIYALCATIYRLITGKVAPSAADRALDDRLVRPTVLGTDITEEQERVLLKGLAVRSAERYLNVFELKNAFKGTESEKKETKDEEKNESIPDFKEGREESLSEKRISELQVPENHQDNIPKEDNKSEKEPEIKKEKRHVGKILTTIIIFILALIICLVLIFGIIANTLISKFRESEFSEEYENFDKIMTEFIGEDYGSIIFEVIKGEKNIFKTVGKIYYINSNYNDEDYKTYFYVEDFRKYDVKIANEIWDELYGSLRSVGRYGDNAFWKLTFDNILTVNGEGKLNGLSAEEEFYDLVKGRNYLCINVGEGITEIGDYVFADIGANATNVYLPESLEILSPLAFEGSENVIFKEGYKEEFAYNQTITPSSIEVGDYITFGSYEQDNNLENGAEPIDWKVLDVQGGKALVISKYGLDCQPYNTEYKSVTWENCSLRIWLNNNFIESAFDKEEQKTIVKTKLSNPDNEKDGTDGGNDTEDKVFLLSTEEAEKYFSSGIERQCKLSVYARVQGMYAAEKERCDWWLRSPGWNQMNATVVTSGGSIQIKYPDGSLHDHSCGVQTVDIAVRPAMWIDVSDIEPENIKVLNSNVSAGKFHSVVLYNNGTAAAFGNNDFGQCNIEYWSNLVEVSAGDSHTVGLRKDGTVVAVGNNTYGMCKVSDWNDIIAISAGNNHTVGIKADGTVVATGWNNNGQCRVSEWTDIVAISAGYQHTVGLKADGTVVSVGLNSKGQCNVSEWADIIAVSAGGQHTVGLKADGTVVCVGSDSDGQCSLENWTNIIAISAGNYHTVGLKADGTVVATGRKTDGRTDVMSWENIVNISAGNLHTLGVTASGTVFTAGSNSDDQCKIPEI